ncbi:glucoamylase family protein [Chryseolinea sp. H1M3-3]|uniref:glucoamylase family protein n=1 Tax=Chryseolinea sp. H1M3-3 TaxID=3034144 RepID=UPI0023EC0123|nr:glucoamylase family protein [Chryseolinea sp. H1M3-3]
MNSRKIFFWSILLVVFQISCSEDDGKEGALMQLSSVKVGDYNLDLNNFGNNTLAPVNEPIVATFSVPLEIATLQQNVRLTQTSTGTDIALSFSFLNNNATFSALPDQPLAEGEQYDLTLSSDLRGAAGETFSGYSIEFETTPKSLKVVSLTLGGVDGLQAGRITDVPCEGAVLEVTFDEALDPSTVTPDNFKVSGNNIVLPISIALSQEDKKVSISVNQKFRDLTRYQLLITDKVKGNKQESLQQFSKFFYTAPDPTPDFPVIADEALLTLVQQQTFKYFWDFAHPASGMARERNSSGNIVTSGGTGFGIMAIIVGMERNFISRNQGVERLDKIVTFLENADRFHGAWSHWIDGNTGQVVPFSAKDDGGDLVETSFLIQGLLTFRQYLQPADTVGNNLIKRINEMWKTVEWDWYRKNNEQVLYWHWSPEFDWAMNFPLYGYFEEQITYVLAAASPSHSIPKSVYTNGYGKNGAIKKGNTFYDYTLPLESPSPLFWVHYSYLGLDPHFTDDFANYWDQNVNATLINQAYCIDNPKNYVGYSDSFWGLTSSDNQNGYAAHSPTNDLGVIAPTAALSSFPYTPTESMKALKFFYYTLGDRLWGEYGFYDAINVTEGWTANSYLAIDQGPTIVMIENYRTGLLWDLFMSAPEAQTAKTVLGFQ